MMVRACERGLKMIEVPILFLPRTKGVAKGVQVAAVLKSIFDIVHNWLAWGWRFRFSQARKAARITRLMRPASLSEEERIITTTVFAKHRPASENQNLN